MRGGGGGPDPHSSPSSIRFGGGCPLTAAAVCHVARRLGEFDGGGPHGAVDGTDLIPRLDSEAHRAIARRTAAESCVLLKNAKQTLPLVVAGAVRGPTYDCRTFAPVDTGIDNLDSLLTRLSRDASWTTQAAPKSIAVVGPFIDDPETLLHSYNGRPSSIVTPLAAVRQVFGGTNSKCSVKHAEGVGPRVAGGGGRHPSAAVDANVSAAVALAARAELTIAVLGLGSRVEFEAVDRGEGPGDWCAFVAALRPRDCILSPRFLLVGTLPFLVVIPRRPDERMLPLPAPLPAAPAPPSAVTASTQLPRATSVRPNNSNQQHGSRPPTHPASQPRLSSSPGRR